MLGRGPGQRSQEVPFPGAPTYARHVPPFCVFRPDMSVETWGVERDAAYEIDKSGNLRVIEFDPLPDGLNHARTATVYRYDDWADVQAGLSE